ncbi:MAG TPA: energy-coupling factor transporter transmembrane component T [Candidatus Limnocylindrales bacterium]|jgi:energy-coupling factor transport system permease protein|nr:energy-coupling factor transporter transmembrane component T [Candidatus Limnocylindrales bacterium]
MNIAPRYLGRGSWLARRDPRVLILIVALFIFTVLQVWDIRFLLVLVVVSVIYYRSAGIPWRYIRRNWTVVFVFIGTLVVVNAIFAGGATAEIPLEDAHVIFTMPILGTPMSAESISLAVTLFLRYLAMATIGFPVAFAVAPADFGVAFRRLGVPEKFAFGIDLTFRFLPSLAADFQTTVDAQRIRGFDWSAGASGFLTRLRRSTPVIVPTVVNAIAGAEDTIDAMDLRAFGTGPRTWLRELRFDRTDRLTLLAFAVLLAVFTVLGFAGITSELYVFPFLLDLANR